MNSIPPEPDYYAILQVHERALPEVIDKVYRVLVRKYHPDVHPAEKKAWAQAKMTQLNIAYDVISDPARRAEYDYRRRYGPDRRRTPTASDQATAAERVLKCFNHPKLPSVAFCWHCGRPICAECLAGERQQRTICVTCTQVLDREATWRPGGDWDHEDVAWRAARRMALPGVLLHYLFLAALLAVVCVAVFQVAIAFGNTRSQALALVSGLALVFAVLLIQRLTWRVICPRCATVVSHPALRSHAPWSEFFAPQPICPGCGRRFRHSELTGGD